MTKKHNTFKRITQSILLAFVASLICITGTMLFATPVYAYTETPSSITDSTNFDFSYNGNTSTMYQNPTGWSKGNNNSDTTSGVVNLDYFNDSYNLSQDEFPNKLGDDSHALMINSKKTSTSIQPAYQYFTNSNSLSLDAYSNYKIVVYTQVTFGANASIYVSGLDDESLYFENIDYSVANEWTGYTFYISTGLETQSIKLELWLGSKPTYTSGGAVFFDNIVFKKISQNEIQNSSSKVKYLNLNKSEIISDIDGDFESGNISNWTNLNPLTVDAYAEILDLSDPNDSIARDITYVGNDLTHDNDSTLVLYTKNDTKAYIGYKSKDIKLKMYDIVKVSVNAKTADLDGSAYIYIKENDVLNANGDVIDEITPVSTSLTVSTTTTNNFTNNYSTYSFYLKGRSLYNTSFTIELSLGSTESTASGLVAFDTITIESVSYSDYTNASTDSYTQKLEFQTAVNNYNIDNSSFNDVQKVEKELSYPLIPNSWTHTAKDSGKIFYGVINTFDDIYDAHKDEFGDFDNPGNPQGFGDTSTDTNNVLLMHNIQETYQSVKSSDFTISSDSYYKLNFAYNVQETTSKTGVFNVYIQDEDGNILYAGENIASTLGDWNNYTVYINTKAYTNTLNLVLSLGKENDFACGVVYLDNVTLVKDENMTADKYATLAETNNVLDFEQGNFNLVKANSDGTFTPLRYTESLENNDETVGLSAGFGGIIDATNNSDGYNIEKSPNSTSALNYLMYLQTMNKATYSLTAKDSLSLSSDTYHKFTIDVKTQGLTSDLDYDEAYGASFALSGLSDKIEGIVAEDWTTYTIYVACTSSVTVNVKFALVSLDFETRGTAFFDNFTYETIEKSDYNLAKLNNEADSTFLFIGDTDADDESSDTSSSFDIQQIWYLIPTLILAVALILALVAYIMKKVNIKKWEKRRINEYDRDRTVHRDIIRVEAEKRRDASVNELKAEIEHVNAEKERIESIHQEQLKATRATRSKGVSKATEREFKQYAKLHTAMENRIANINKQIENMNTPEFLLSVQHKIIIEKAKQERIAKEKAYEQEKLEKKAKKANKKSK